VDTLLELSSINKFQNKEEVNIKDIVGSVLEKYHDKIKDFNINIKLDDVKLWVNKYQFEMLFENLLKNAINYNNEKKRIEIVLNKNYLDIKNTTNKLPNFSKIFDLFYKERSS
jgi:signal transduction histidine kinase